MLEIVISIIILLVLAVTLHVVGAVQEALRQFLEL